MANTTSLLQSYEYSVVERFMQYVQVDTQSDPNSTTQPSTLKQLNLSRILVQELLELGLTDAILDENGYVYATLSSNSDKNTIPTICFCAHVDTAPDCSGTNVKPILHKNYQGGVITFPDDETLTLDPNKSKYLLQNIGSDIITASGLTLLGADDKGGVAVIMDAVRFLTAHPEIKHGTIKILFTPDEEIGRGVDKVDLKHLGADFAYTLDGGPSGSLEDETFSADAVTITIQGVSAHPGYAKNSMEHALKIGGRILAALPKERLAPEVTSGREGFVHPTSFNGVLEKAVLTFIIRDFEDENLIKHENELRQVVESVMKDFPNSSYTFEVKEQYRNMKRVVDKHPQLIEFAKEAVRRVGLEPTMHPIRGGTDGSRLTYMGLPCPNLFTGMMDIHSKTEWVSSKDLKDAVKMLVHLSSVWEEKTV